MPTKPRPILTQPRGESYRYIALTKNLVTTVDAEDFEWLIQFNWYAWRTKTLWYAMRNESVAGADGRLVQHSVLMHRAIFGLETPLVDHIDGDCLNNRRANLRAATFAENARNGKMKSSNTSGVKGVHFDKDSGKWRAQIRVDRRTIPIGRYLDKEDAAKAYAEASLKYHGSFGTLR